EFETDRIWPTHSECVSTTSRSGSRSSRSLTLTDADDADYTTLFRAATCFLRTQWPGALPREYSSDKTHGPNATPVCRGCRHTAVPLARTPASRIASRLRPPHTRAALYESVPVIHRPWTWSPTAKGPLRLSSDSPSRLWRWNGSARFPASPSPSASGRRASATF